MATSLRFVRSTIKRCLSLGPLPIWIQSMMTPRCLAVLTYHSVIERPLPFADWSFLDLAAFRRQVAYLRAHFAILPLAEAVKRLRQDALDGPSVAITFDDGFANNYHLAFPVLREFQAPATIYLTTDLIGSETTVWFTRLITALQNTTHTSLHWEGREFSLRDAQARAAASARLQEALKRYPATELFAHLREIETRLAVCPNPPVGDASPFRMLTPEMVSEMQASGLVEFGAHTCNHAILSRLSEEEQFRQIGESVRRVTELSGVRCRSFAYPNGARHDYDPRSQEILASLGIEAALTMVPGPNRPQTPPMAMHRYPIGADTDFDRFRLMVHNVG